MSARTALDYSRLDAVTSLGELTFFRAVDPSGALRLLCVLEVERPTPEQIERVQIAYRMAARIANPGVLRAERVLPVAHSFAVVHEAFPGDSLAHVLERAPLDVGSALHVAAALSDALAALHDERLVLGSLCPALVLVDGTRAKIASLAWATEGNDGARRTAGQLALEAAPAYVAPEQTGRTSRALDHRTDLYALGATLYHMLAGHPPFRSTNLLELVHAHVAVPPPDVRASAPHVPASVAAIVDKLLAKNPDERFQTARSLGADLAACLDASAHGAELRDFVPGRADAGRLRRPARLHGRDVECNRLFRAFERATAGGREVLLVTGSSGVGKSALIAELERTASGRGATFLSGKYDQLREERPYEGFVQAFEKVARAVLARPSARVRAWREHTLAALENEGQLLVDAVPELQAILGPQPPVDPLPPLAAQGRFDDLIVRFVGSLARERTLVLWLDDVHWADPSSLRLLRKLATSPALEHLLLLASARNNELPLGHPVLALRDELQGATPDPIELAVDPISLVATADIVADVLGTTSERVSPLATVLHDKAGGNPFFLFQLVRSVHETGALTFDGHAWQWDLDRIRARSATENVIELLTRSIAVAPAALREALGAAACIGNTFDVRCLATVRDIPLPVAAAEVIDAVERGLFDASDAALGELRHLTAAPVQRDAERTSIPCQFAHDRVQQAAFALVAPAELPAMRLRVGRALCSVLSAEAREAAVLEIATQFQGGLELVTDAAERREIAHFNAKAGFRARSASAYDAAARYLAIALRLLPEEAWTTDHDLMREVHTAMATSQIAAGALDEAMRLYEIALRHAKTVVEKADLSYLVIDLCMMRKQAARAVDIGREVLALLGVSVPRGAFKVAMAAQLVELKLRLRKTPVSTLPELPATSDPEKLAALGLMLAITPPCFQVSIDLFSWLSLYSVNYAIVHGVAASSAEGIQTMGMIFGSGLGDHDTAIAAADAALALHRRFNDVSRRSQLYFVYSFALASWKRHIRETFPFLRDGGTVGERASNFLNADFCHMFLGIHLLMAGAPIADTRLEMEKLLERVRQRREEVNTTVLAMLVQVCLALEGRTLSPTSLETADVSESALVAPLVPSESRYFLGLYHLFKAQLHYLYGDIDGAARHIRESRKRVDAAFAMFQTAEHTFYEGLISCAEALRARGVSKHRLLARAKAAHRRLSRWARHCPMNFRHRALFVEAEIARASGAPRAEVLYERAIADALEQEFVQNAALATERLADLYRERGLLRVCSFYVDDAAYLYGRWGAASKVASLTERYGPTVRTTGKDRHERDVDDADVIAIVDGSQTIARDIRIDDLLRNVMQIVSENAGAQRSALLLASEGQLSIEARFSVDKGITVEKVSLDASADVPRSVLMAVMSTGKELLLRLPAEEGDFKADPYVRARQPKVMLCVPLRARGVVAGLVYLENDATADAFTSKTARVVGYLAAQAAIALENAKLYANLEERVAARTAELRETQARLLVLQRETTERRMAGGFAHEIRNALGASKLTLDRVLGVGGSGVIGTSFSKQSARDVGEVYGLMKERLAAEDLEMVREKLGAVIGREERLDKMLELVSQSTRRALRITRSIMEFARLGEMRASEGAVPIDTIMRQALASMEDDLRSNGIEYAVQLPEQSVAVAGDEEHLNAVFSNLLRNARDAIADVEVDVEQRPRRIVIFGEVAQDECVIRVSDTGVGIPEANRAHIFEAFFSTKPESGIGLGLGMVQKIVSLYGGQVDFESEEQVGTTFSVRLPIRRIAADVALA